MTVYAFWNNKGGVGKSFLSFVAATEYARTYPDTDVYVINLCPQANISEMLLLNAEMLINSDEMRLIGYDVIHRNYDVIHRLIEKKPRATVAGYLEARLNSPFRTIKDVGPLCMSPSGLQRKTSSKFIVDLRRLSARNPIRGNAPDFSISDSSGCVETGAQLD